jgi:hypothetical protein
MTHPMLKTILPALLAAALAAGCNEGGGTGPRPEVAETEIKLDMPAIPEFPEAKPYTDGSHSVTEMRLRGAKFLDQQVKVTGYVVFNYDLATCAKELGDKAVQADPKLCEGKKDIVDCTTKVGQKAVTETPNLCDRPYFYLGDAPNASFEKSIWIVEVPRPLRDDEKKDPALVADFAKKPPPPKVNVGDKVTVGGQWAIKSPMGFGNSEGLLVYGDFAAAAPQ